MGFREVDLRTFRQDVDQARKYFNNTREDLVPQAIELMQKAYNSTPMPFLAKELAFMKQIQEAADEAGVEYKEYQEPKKSWSEWWQGN